MEFYFFLGIAIHESALDQRGIRMNDVPAAEFSLNKNSEIIGRGNKDRRVPRCPIKNPLNAGRTRDFVSKLFQNHEPRGEEPQLGFVGHRIAGRPRKNRSSAWGNCREKCPGTGAGYVRSHRR
jgi:hypothetical protein